MQYLVVANIRRGGVQPTAISGQLSALRITKGHNSIWRSPESGKTLDTTHLLRKVYVYCVKYLRPSDFGLRAFAGMDGGMGMDSCLRRNDKRKRYGGLYLPYRNG